MELGWQDRIGDFAYGVRANVATLKNKVTKMHESLSSIDGATYVTYGAITRFEVGKPAWYFMVMISWVWIQKPVSQSLEILMV